MKAMHGMKHVAGQLLACALLTCVMAASAGQVTMDAEADRLLTAELNRLLKKMPRIEGQQAYVTGTARLDLSNCLVRVNLSRGFVPRYNLSEFEDQMNDLQVMINHFAENMGCQGTTTFMFGGIDINHYFPEDAVSPLPSFGGLSISAFSVFSEDALRHFPVPASSSRPIVRRF